MATIKVTIEVEFGAYDRDTFPSGFAEQMTRYIRDWNEGRYPYESEKLTDALNAIGTTAMRKCGGKERVYVREDSYEVK